MDVYRLQAKPTTHMRGLISRFLFIVKFSIMNKNFNQQDLKLNFTRQVNNNIRSVNKEIYASP